MGSKEASARVKINKLLEDAGWRFFDSAEGRANIQLELKTSITQAQLDELGTNFESTKRGYVDFLLLDDHSFPLVVLEAKREDINPLFAKDQARKYAKSVKARFVILTNGNQHYLWDTEQGNPELITKFPTQSSLQEFQSYKPDPEALSKEKAGAEYIARSQLPAYEDDPDWQNEEKREAFIERSKLKFMRPYQVKAIEALQESSTKGARRFLFEMATGTGKTLTTAAVAKLFLRSGNARRVLFLVDRLELEDQAKKAFTSYLSNDYTVMIYKDARDSWRSAEIVISTVQTLLSSDRYKTEFSPTDFELVISDEAHRSISGNARAVFEYFAGYKLGLTATPKDYLKNVEENLGQSTQKEFERRQLLDTYRTFGCESLTPTFRYSLLDGVKEGYLINPVVADARTEITTPLLSEEGYAVAQKDDEGNEKEETYFARDFEKRFFNEKTNVSFCKTFMTHALKDPLTQEIGKTVIFCVSQSHASKITQILNKLAHEIFPNKYQSDFAEQVTSGVTSAQQMTVQFSNNNLNGTTKFEDGYSSSKTRVCVTVGMMTTGYDCQDLLNIVLMRPIFSPSDFVQMKGRGTRTYTFRHVDYSTKKETAVEKAQYKLFDFFANCEYFEDKFDYDEVLELPPEVTKREGPESPKPDIGEIDLGELDKLKTLHQQDVGKKGMKIDRKYFDEFIDELKGHKELTNLVDDNDYEGAEDYLRAKVFDKPEHFMNPTKIRESLGLDRKISLKEVVDYIRGSITDFKSSDELLDEEFEKFVAVENVDHEHYQVARHFFKAYATDPEIRKIVRNKDYAQFHHNAKLSFEEFKALNGYRERVPQYIEDYVKTEVFG